MNTIYYFRGGAPDEWMGGGREGWMEKMGWRQGLLTVSVPNLFLAAEEEEVFFGRNRVFQKPFLGFSCGRLMSTAHVPERPLRKDVVKVI